MQPYQKPRREDRVRSKQGQKERLQAYRRVQSALAIDRDGDQCVICWFKHRRERRRDDIHHVFGRGDQAGDWREKYTSLMSVCRACHPLPIQTPGGSSHLAWVEEILEEANRTPINRRFRHPR